MKHGGDIVAGGRGLRAVDPHAVLIPLNVFSSGPQADSTVKDAVIPKVIPNDTKIALFCTVEQVVSA